MRVSECTVRFSFFSSARSCCCVGVYAPTGAPFLSLKLCTLWLPPWVEMVKSLHTYLTSPAAWSVGLTLFTCTHISISVQLNKMNYEQSIDFEAVLNSWISPFSLNSPHIFLKAGMVKKAKKARECTH